MTLQDIAPLLAVVAGAVSALLLSIVLGRERQWLCSLVAIAASVAALGLAARLASRPAELTFHGAWARDGATHFAQGTIALVTAIVAAISPRWLATDRRHGEWYAVLLFSAAGAMALAGAADLLELVVAMLLASVTGYTLASYHRQSRMGAEAGAKYFLLGALSNPLLFVGATLVYGLAGTTTYAEIETSLAASADPVALAVAAALVILGLGFELGAAPTHPWVPDVAQGAPAPAAAFLTVAPKVGALFALGRFVTVLPEDHLLWRPAVAIVAATTMSIGNLAAAFQDDVRRLLGWSSVSQAGYGLLAVVALGRSDLAETSLAIFAAAYAIANVAAFAVVISLRGRTKLDDYRGLARSRPLHAAALALALLSLAGMPPLVGFGAKLLLFGAAVDAGYTWLAVLAAVNTVLSFFYYVRVIASTVLAPPADEPALLGRVAAAVAVGTGLGALALGIALEALTRVARAAVFLP